MTFKKWIKELEEMGLQNKSGQYYQGWNNTLLTHYGCGLHT